jgi:Tfp pilus assembly protein PilV
VRRGSSLIEALLALLVLQFGLLALAATSVVAARDLANANRRARAHSLGLHRVELLSARACPAPQAGSREHAGGLTEFWRVEALGLMRAIADSVDMRLPQGRSAHVVIRAWTAC